MDTKKRLEELRAILRSESMSYDELHELQDFGERGLIEPDDVELLEAAGVPEHHNGDMATRKLSLHIDGDVGVKSRIELDDFGVTHYVDGDTDMVAELVRRWNAYPELVEALKGLVQTSEFQAEGNFLNEDADEGEENDLTRARALLQTLKP